MRAQVGWTCARRTVRLGVSRWLDSHRTQESRLRHGGGVVSHKQVGSREVYWVGRGIPHGANVSDDCLSDR